MDIKVKGIALLLAGVLGATFVGTFDIIMGKPVNDVTGPRSTPVLMICAVFIIMGVRLILGKPKK